MRVLQIGSDRSKRGVLFPDSPAAARQRAYAERLGQLDIIGFSRRSDGVRDHSEPHLNVYPTTSASRFLYGFDAMRIAKKLSRPDVVTVQDPFEAGLVGWLIARRWGVPLHVQVHTDLLSREYAKSPLGHVRRLLARFVLSRATRVRVVSDRIKTSLENSFHLEAPISVLPIFVDIEKFRNAKASPELVAKFVDFKTKLLVVGRLELEKNIELAIRAFAEAAPKDACLIVVGEGSERERLRRLAHPVSDRVFFEGQHPGVSYYSLANLVLVPSKYEGYGLVIVEALAAGKPVLSTDVGIAREAGAIVSSEKNLVNDLKRWFEHGPREGALKSYPYKSFDDYVRAYCEDIEACTKQK